MIISVSMNPSVDKILNLSEFKVGHLNRVVSKKETAGGKGINVANDVAAFTNELVLTGFVGDGNNEVINNCIFELTQKNVVVDFVEIHGNNRTNLKVIEDSGRLTEINESGFSVTEEDVKKLKDKLMKYAGKNNIFVLTGSVPKGVDDELYAELTKTLKESNSAVYVDTDGVQLKHSVEQIPDMIKPNEVELLDLFGDKNISEKTLINRAKELVKKGIKLVIVSRGDQGALFVKEDSVIKCEAMDIDIVSTVGAGDAMVAAFAYANEIGYDYEDSIRLSVAASAHTVTKATPYYTDKDEIEKLMHKVNLQYIY